MKARAIRQEPITPMVDEEPPGFVVACLDCGYAVDAHGQTPEDAVVAVSTQHQQGHRLIAHAVDYRQHPLYTS